MKLELTGLGGYKEYMLRLVPLKDISTSTVSSVILHVMLESECKVTRDANIMGPPNI